MKKIKFNGQQINVPSNWSEITLGNYEKWHTARPATHDTLVHYIADLCQIDINKLMNAPAKVFDAITDTIQFASQNEYEPQQSINIGKQKYSISSSDELTLGEWVDIDAAMNNENTALLSDILAIVCRPAGESYDHEKSEERAKLFREQSCDKMLPLVSFFLRKEKESEEILNHCLVVVEAASQFLEDIKTFAASGDGIKQLPIWQRIRYSSLTKSLEKQLSKFSDSYSIE